MSATEEIARDIELQSHLTTLVRTESELVAGLYGLLYDAISHDVDRRSEFRDPLTAPVIFHLGNDEKRVGLTRDISTDGIGLVHSFSIECNDIAIEVIGRNGIPTVLFVKIEWCEPLGAGWFISGGRFVFSPSEIDGAIG